MSLNADLTGSTVEAVLVKLLSERAMYGYGSVARIENNDSPLLMNWLPCADLNKR